MYKKINFVFAGCLMFGASLFASDVSRSEKIDKLTSCLVGLNSDYEGKDVSKLQKKIRDIDPVLFDTTEKSFKGCGRWMFDAHYQKTALQTVANQMIVALEKDNN